MLVSAFSNKFDRADFQCGIDELNIYLQQRLSQDIKKCVAAGFILHEKESAEILGYYTLSSVSINLHSLPDSIQSTLPRYPEVPGTLLGRLAISIKHQGKGMGEKLLLNALHRAWENREVIGSWAVCVDAINDEAVMFYEHFGFQRVTQEARLVLPMIGVGKLF